MTRDSRVSRQAISHPAQNRVWARAAGRCVLCAAYLIGEQSYFHSTSVGEIAHNAGATTNARSPRGSAAVPVGDRADESNLLLLCHSCHRQIDDPELVGKYTETFLRSKKSAHERRVRQVTAFGTLTPTAVLRMTGKIRGTYRPITDLEVAEALRVSGLTAHGEDPRAETIDIELPDSETDGFAWDRGMSIIDEQVAHVDGVLRRGHASVLSVFAIAPIPLLTYLGSRLDDKSDVRLFRRARTDGPLAWAWNSPTTSAPRFEIHADEPNDMARDLVVLASVTAHVNRDRVPSVLRGVPTMELRADPPAPSAISTPEALGAFGEAWRAMLAKMEKSFRSTRRIHLIAAVPAVAAIEMGRARMREAHPKMTVYQRTDLDTYEPAITVE